MSEFYGWLLWEQYHESDYTFGGVVDWSMIKKPTRTFWTNRIQYDQRFIPEGKNDCTVVSAMGMYSDLSGYEFSNAEHQEIHDLAVEATDGSIVTEWWYLPKANDLVRHYVRDNPIPFKVSSARVLTGWEDFLKALEMWFSVQVGYGGNKRYNDAKDNDGDMSLTEWGEPTYYHAVRRTDDKVALYIVDNYEGRLLHNIYTIPKFMEIIKDGKYFFTWSYFYFQEIDLTMENLPAHLDKDKVATPSRREVVIAWENEVSKWLTDGGDISKLFGNYQADNKLDEWDVIARMLIDLDFIRRS